MVTDSNDAKKNRSLDQMESPRSELAAIAPHAPTQKLLLAHEVHHLEELLPCSTQVEAAAATSQRHLQGIKNAAKLALEATSERRHQHRHRRLLPRKKLIDVLPAPDPPQIMRLVDAAASSRRRRRHAEDHGHGIRSSSRGRRLRSNTDLQILAPANKNKAFMREARIRYSDWKLFSSVSGEDTAMADGSSSAAMTTTLKHTRSQTDGNNHLQLLWRQQESMDNDRELMNDFAEMEKLAAMLPDDAHGSSMSSNCTSNRELKTLAAAAHHRPRSDGAAACRSMAMDATSRTLNRNINDVLEAVRAAMSEMALEVREEEASEQQQSVVATTEYNWSLCGDISMEASSSSCQSMSEEMASISVGDGDGGKAVTRPVTVSSATSNNARTMTSHGDGGKAVTRQLVAVSSATLTNAGKIMSGDGDGGKGVLQDAATSSSATASDCKAGTTTVTVLQDMASAMRTVVELLESFHLDLQSFIDRRRNHRSAQFQSCVRSMITLCHSFLQQQQHEEDEDEKFDTIDFLAELASALEWLINYAFASEPTADMAAHHQATSCSAAAVAGSADEATASTFDTKPEDGRRGRQRQTLNSIGKLQAVKAVRSRPETEETQASEAAAMMSSLESRRYLQQASVGKEATATETSLMSAAGATETVESTTLSASPVSVCRRLSAAAESEALESTIATTSVSSAAMSMESRLISAEAAESKSMESRVISAEATAKAMAMDPRLISAKAAEATAGSYTTAAAKVYVEKQRKEIGICSTPPSRLQMQNRSPSPSSSSCRASPWSIEERRRAYSSRHEWKQLQKQSPSPNNSSRNVGYEDGNRPSSRMRTRGPSMSYGGEGDMARRYFPSIMKPAPPSSSSSSSFTCSPPGSSSPSLFLSLKAWETPTEPPPSSSSPAKQGKGLSRFFFPRTKTKAKGTS